MKTPIPPTKPPRAPRADARENRARILQAAHDRFAADGLAAEMDAIARDAGVAVGTLYHHFGTKEALLEAIVLEALQELDAFLQTLLVEPDPWQAVEKLVRYLAERRIKDQSFGALIGSQPSIRAVTKTIKRGMGPVMEQILGRARAAGKLRAEVKAGDIPLLIAGLAESDATPATQERYLNIILNGLRA
jgi:AcrR family transcriptional regulator